MKLIPWAAVFAALTLPLSAQKTATPAGGVTGSWILGSIGVGNGKDGGTPKTTARKGMAIRIGEHGEAAVAYDLELCRMAGAWTGSFATPTGFIHSATFTTGEVPGFIIGQEEGSAEGQPSPVGNSPAERRVAEPGGTGGDRSGTTWRDPRAEPIGPLPPGQAIFKGFYVNGARTILKWDIGGVEVLELPAYDVVLNGGGYFTRTFQVAPSTEAIQILVAANPQPDGPVNFPTHKKTEGEVPGLEDKERVMQSTPWVHGDCGEVMVWAAGDPDGSAWRLVNGELALEVPPHSKPATFQIACWSAPKNDPDGHSAPLYFREPQIDLVAIGAGGVWRSDSGALGKAAK